MQRVQSAITDETKSVDTGWGLTCIMTFAIFDIVQKLDTGDYVGPRNVWLEEVHPVVLWCEGLAPASHCKIGEINIRTEEDVFVDDLA